MSTVGQRLRWVRERKGLQQIDVAKKTGLNNKTLSGYERGVSEPDLQTLSTLAGLYGVSVDWLAGRTDDMTPPSKVSRNQPHAGRPSFPGGVIGRGKPDDDDDLLTPEEEERLRQLLTDPELGLAFRKGALAKNTNRRRLLMALELLASDDDEGWER